MLAPHHALGATRLLVGVVSLTAPKTAARAFGVPPSADPWITRLFGSRELALAAGLLAAPAPTRRALALTGAAIDGADVLSTAVEVRRGTLSTYAAVVGGGGAALFTVLGLLAARDTQV